MKSRLALGFQWAALGAAILAPFFIIKFFPLFNHARDIRTFIIWGQAWKVDWRDIYLYCESCNYPLLGTAFSGGVFSGMDIYSRLRAINRFRYFLALIDGTNILMLYFIFSKLKIRHAPLWAGVIGLLPSSWIGSSVWGQIEGAGLTWILMFIALLIVFNEQRRSRFVYLAFLFSASVLLSAMILTKQLLYFSAFGLGIVLLANMVIYSSKMKSIVASALFSTAALIAPIVVLDRILRLPQRYLSHLQYILATGSDHGDVLSSYGLNIWALVSSRMLESSRAPLFSEGNVLHFIVPYYAGLVLFFLTLCAITHFFLRDIFHRRDSNGVFNRAQVLSACAYLLTLNFSFNIFLTGVHERYLFYAFAFGFIFYLGRKDYKMFALLALAAFAYGAYLYAYLEGFMKQDETLIVQIAAALNLILFIGLTLSWRKYLLTDNDYLVG